VTEREILDALQAAVDSRDIDRLLALFDEPAMLIGASGDGRDRDGLVRYLAGVAAGEPFRWEWSEIVPFHRDERSVGFAAFGEVVAADQRAPIRATVLAVDTPSGWRIREFHGSIPFAG
jgi:hypothetical protein